MIKLLKRLERISIISASHIITLSNKSINFLKKNTIYSNLDISYIPTCVDTSKYVINNNKEKNNNKIVLGCIGTINSEWFLTEWLANFYSIFRETHPHSFLNIITHDEHGPIKKIMNKYNVDNYRIYSCSSNQIVNEINNIDINLMFFSNNFAKIASCPTRLAESLACGVPCIANPGLGDIEDLIKNNNVGVILNNNNRNEIVNSIQKIMKLLEDKKIKQNCRNTAIKLFDANLGAKNIHLIYKKIINK